MKMTRAEKALPKNSPRKRVGSGRLVRRSGLIGLFEKLNDKVTVSRVRGGLIFFWSRKGVGFGSLTLTAKRGKLTVDAECMGPDFCASVVRQAIAEATPPNA
jgi:hypothetical protein